MDGSDRAGTADAATGMLALRVAAAGTAESLMIRQQGLTEAMFAEYGRVPIEMG